MIQFTIQLGRTRSLWLYYRYHLTPLLTTLTPILGCFFKDMISGLVGCHCSTKNFLDDPYFGN